MNERSSRVVLKLLYRSPGAIEQSPNEQRACKAVTIDLRLFTIWAEHVTEAPVYHLPQLISQY